VGAVKKNRARCSSCSKGELPDEPPLAFVLRRVPPNAALPESSTIRGNRACHFSAHLYHPNRESHVQGKTTDVRVRLLTEVSRNSKGTQTEAAEMMGDGS